MRLLSTWLVLGTALASTTAWAQEPAPAPAPQGGVEEILVTARRQSENLQRTPVSVSALTSATLENLNMASPVKITQLVPNLALSEASGNIGGLNAYIRGIGANEPLLTVDSGVGFYIDGVYLGRSAASNLDIVGPERIEVLRGPQGTLFGRNTTGGAVNIVTRAPRDEFGVEAKVGTGSFSALNGRLSVDTGEWGSSGISATISGMHRQRNGFADNPGVPSSKDPGALRSDALFGKVHGDWGALTLDVTGDWNHIVGQRNPFQVTDVYPVASYYNQSPSLGGGTLLVSDKFVRDAPVAYLGPQKTTTWGTAATAAYEFAPEVTLKSITSWRGWNSSQPTNYAPALRGRVLDFASPTLVSVQSVSPFVAPVQDIRQRQFSQEVQLLGKTDTLSYIIGGYYFNERGVEDNDTAFTLLVPSNQLAAFGFGQGTQDAIVGQGIDIIGVNLAGNLHYITKSTSLAGFGQMSWKPEFADGRLELTGGARVTRDKREVDVTSISAPQPVAGGIPSTTYPVGPSRSDSASFSNWSFLTSASYQWTPSVMTFARFSTGYKSGGFYARANATQQLSFAPEKATAFEFGFKSEMFDRRLRLNGSAFYTKYKGLQVPQFTGTNSGFVPNANAHYQGFELEFVALPDPAFQIDGSIGYVDAVYDKFQLTPTLDITKTAHFPYVPKINTHIGAQYSMPISIGKVTLRADYAYQSKRYFFTDVAVNPLNDAIAAKGEHLVSARLSLADVAIGNGTATFSLFGENLLDQTLRPAGIDFGPSLGFAGINFGVPRTWGVEASFKF